MNKEIEYYSKDKVYKIKKNKISKLGMLVFSILPTIILLIATYLCFEESVTLNRNGRVVKYKETGNIDYKVYLKDNNYYDESYLNSGMQYVASLINTINVKFNYKVKASENMDFSDKYRVVGELIITDEDDSSKILYRKKENLIDDKVINIESAEFKIEEETDIDYEKYTTIVEEYKKNLGLDVSSKLIVRLETTAEGIIEEEKASIDNKIQMIIPLSESTINIKIDTDKIKSDGTIGNVYSSFKINNENLFMVFIFLSIVSILSIILDIYIYIKYFKNDIYKSTVNSILREYDRLIVTGKVSIDEANYPTKIYPVTFEEMVDAARNLDVPIMHYEPIPGEKSFFVIVKDDTIYKYRLTRAFLERNPNNVVKKNKTNESYYEMNYSYFENINNIDDDIVEEEIVPIMEDPDEEENIEDLTIKILQEELEPKKEKTVKKKTTTKKVSEKKTTAKKTTKKKTPAKKTTTKKVSNNKE